MNSSKSISLSLSISTFLMSLSFDFRPERDFHFLDQDFAAAVFVEHFEGSPEVFFFQVHILLHCRCYELGVVDCSAVVSIDRLHDGNEFVFDLMPVRPSLSSFSVMFPSPLRSRVSKALFYMLDFFARHMCCNVRDGSLFHLLVVLELSEVSHVHLVEFFFLWAFGESFDPRMLDCFLCSQTDFGFSDETRYEVFSFIKKVLPLVSFEVELAVSHGLDDFLSF